MGITVVAGLKSEASASAHSWNVGKISRQRASDTGTQIMSQSPENMCVCVCTHVCVCVVGREVGKAGSFKIFAKM